MLITIISDASFCHRTKCGGYGIWVASKRGKKAFGGPAHGHTDNTVVECIAVANGLYHGIEAGLIYTNDVILFQTDCKAAIHMFEGKRPPRGEEQQVYKWFMDTIVENRLSFQFRHVKGHSGRMDSRSLAQDKCDEIAGMHMRKGRRRMDYDKLKVDTAKSIIPKPKKVNIEKQQSWVRKLKLLVREHTKVNFNGSI